MQDKVRKIGQIAVATVIALALFLYATTTEYKNNISLNSLKQTQAKETYTHTIANVPVSVKYDSEKYFISGFSPTVTVDLIGSNRVALQAETDEATRTFQVVADLREVGAGTQNVEIKVTNLPKGINAKVNPATFTVKIGKRMTEAYTIEENIKASQIAKGYSISKVVLGNETVKVTTDDATLAAIDHVEAVVPDIEKLSDDYSGTATLQAVDTQGNILPVVFSQDTTSIQISITKKK